MSDESRNGMSGAEDENDRQQLVLQLRRRAMDLLARREHSRHELGGKLHSRFEDADEVMVGEVLDQLEADNLLSDVRFAESYVRMRRDRGYGPLYILSQFGKRGVDPAAVEAALDSGDEHWITVAEEALSRKARSKSSLDSLRERNRLQRFLASRGFTAEQSHKALCRLEEGFDEEC
ncbi:MAG: regulatory protein RecX [Pseudohongiellaceae bacterium]